MLKSSQKLKYIDALRGLAILAVLLTHCSQIGAGTALMPFAFKTIINQGLRGVQLFYVASAFTMFYTLSGRVKKELHPNRNFFIRRFFRIAPMYWLAIGYYLWQNGLGPSYWLGDAPGISTWNIISNFLFIHGLSPYWINSLVPGGWSIAVEMSFYCFVPFLFYHIKNIMHALNFFLISMIICLIAGYFLQLHPLIAHEELWANYLTLYLPSQMPVFALGVIFYFLVKGELTSIKFSWVTFLLLVLLLIVKLITAMPLIYSYLVFSMAFVLLGYVLSKKEFRLLVNLFTMYIGKVSYSMYLVHFAVLYVMERLNLIDYMQITGETPAVINYSIRLVILLVFSTVLSTVTYSLVEVPLQKAGKKIIDSLEHKHVAFVPEGGV